MNLDSGVTAGQMTGALTSFRGNQASLTFHAIATYSYVTERSTNMTDWVPVSTNTASSNGTINVIDTFQDLGGATRGAGRACLHAAQKRRQKMENEILIVLSPPTVPQPSTRGRF